MKKRHQCVNPAGETVREVALACLDIVHTAVGFAGKECPYRKVN